MKKIFITGIGTGVGKTLVSAIITEVLQADYWKPVQTGSIEGTDSETVKELISNTKTQIHKEAFCLKKPVSPHQAAEEEGVSIAIKDIHLSKTQNNVVIEGAGGLMVPLNDKELMIDMIKALDAEVILVVRHYLGSINHTLLSANTLKNSGLKVLGIIYSGEANAASEKAIGNFCTYPVLGRIKEEKAITKEVISHYAKEIGPAIKSHL
jgi:dethiobiotin synthetase